MKTLQELVESFALYAVCEACERTDVIDVDQLIKQDGADYPIERVRMRLFCAKCKQRTQSLRIVYIGPEGRASGFRYAR